MATAVPVRSKELLRFKEIGSQWRRRGVEERKAFRGNGRVRRAVSGLFTNKRLIDAGIPNTAGVKGKQQSPSSLLQP